MDELAQAGLTANPGVKVQCPWIGEAPAAFECRHHTTLGIGNSREIILGEVLFAHFRSDVVDAAKHYVDPAALDAGGRVVFGATVDLEEEESGDAVTYQIVGEDEADLKAGRISVGSPIARAMIGKEAGDVAHVQAPGGVKSYEIIGVRYS